MSYHYLDETKANDEHSLPDVEVFQAQSLVCTECELELPRYTDEDSLEGWCEGCQEIRVFRLTKEEFWWYAYGMPGCMWDSEVPYGPFLSEDAALEDAREGAGVG